MRQVKVEPLLAEAQPGERFQFERLGYFCREGEAGGEDLIFNRVTTLRDTWAKLGEK